MYIQTEQELGWVAVLLLVGTGQPTCQAVKKASLLRAWCEQFSFPLYIGQWLSVGWKMLKAQSRSRLLKPSRTTQLLPAALHSQGSGHFSQD